MYTTQIRSSRADGVAAQESLMPPLSAPRFRYEMTFQTHDRSVPATRRAAKAILLGGTPDMKDDCLDRALLIITELVANTVQHAARLSPRAELTLVTDDHCLTIAVHDRDPHLPLVLPPRTRMTSEDGAFGSYTTSPPRSTAPWKSAATPIGGARLYTSPCPSDLPGVLPVEGDVQPQETRLIVQVLGSWLGTAEYWQAPL